MPVPIAELFVSVSADVSAALAGLQALSGALQNAESRFAAATPAAAAFVAAGAGIGLAFAKATEESAHFETKLTEVRNNTVMTDKDMQAMRDTVLSLGEQGPAPLEQIATGFMHVSNLGFNAADSALVLEAAWKSAVSTGANVSNTAEVLAQIMHEFNMPASRAVQTMDELHIAAAEGNLTLEQFNQSFGQVAAWASSVGVPLDQAAAAFATMTRHGFDAAMAGTQVKDQIEHMIRPSAQAEKVIKDLSQRSGVDLVHAFSATGLHALGLTGVLDMAHGAMNRLGLSQAEQTAVWMRLIPNIRGGAASFVLAGNGAEDYARILGDVKTSTGATDQAFERIQNTLGFQWGTATNELRELAITVGDILAPGVKELVGHFRDAVSQFQRLPSPVQEGLVKFVGMAGGIMFVVGAFVLVAPLIGGVVGAFGALLGLLITLSPFFLIAAGLGLLLKKAWEENFLGIRDIVESSLTDLPQKFATLQAAWDAITTGHGDQVLEWFKTLLPEGMQEAGAKIEGSAIGPALGKIGDLLRDLAAGDTDKVLGFFGDKLPDSLKQFAGQVVTLLPTLDDVGGFFSSVGTLVSSFDPAAIGTKLGTFFSDLGDRLQKFAAPLAPLIPVFEGLARVFASIVNVANAFDELKKRTAGSGGGGGEDPILAGLQRIVDFVVKNGDALQALSIVFGPLFTLLVEHGPQVGAILNNLADALDRLADSIRRMPTPPAWMSAVLQGDVIGVGANLGRAGGAAIAPSLTQSNVSAAVAGAQSATSPLITIGTMVFQKEEQARSFLAEMAAVIADAANRVTVPPDNSGNPALVPGPS